MPQENQQRSLRWRETGIKTRIVAAVASLGALVLVLFLWGFVIEPSRRVTAEYEVAIPGWSAPCEGIRVAVLADLHVGSPFNGPAALIDTVSRTQDAQPDLILLAGDYVIDGVVGGSFTRPEAIARDLGSLAAPLGVWAVLGNHDLWLDGERVRAALESSGIRVLENQSSQIHFGDCRFWLVGVSDFRAGQPDIGAALAEVTDLAPVLAFTHNPDVFPEVPERVSLTIAGHTHGGQVYIPLIGRPIVPSRYGERYAIGHVVENGRHLFVSSGIGTSIIPVRFLVPPEVTIIRMGGDTATSH